jgi:hypothetical protein
MGEGLRRLGLTWCAEHRTLAMFCCAAPAQPSHNWGQHNAVRRYTSLMMQGRVHPFTRAGGPIQGIHEDPEAVNAALAAATTKRLALKDLIATNPVTPTHVGLMLRGQAPEVRLNTAFDSADMPTVITVGHLHVLADGHHRATAAWAKGATHMTVRVLSGVTPVFQNGTGLLLEPAE